MLLRIEKREKSYVYEVLETTGTKSNETSFKESIPVLEVEPVIYYCKFSSEFLEDFNQILNNYKINTGTATFEYYDATFARKATLESFLDSHNDFRVVYKSNGAYTIMNVLRSGCE